MIKRSSKKTKLILSVIALAEVLILAAGITFSWMEGGNRGYIEGNEIVINSGSNLTMMQDGKSVNTITIPTCTLEETSSCDGRNFFFPMADNTTNVTSDMTFREGTPADRNTKYLSIDFELIAGNSETKVYLGAGTVVQTSNQDLMNALRMSFSTNDGSTPIVFKPNQLPGVTMSYNPITSISESGSPTTTPTETDAYGDYYYKGETSSTHLFKIGANETKHITLNIWLEGTAFNSDEVALKDLSVYIDFTTQVDDLIKYNFIDNTHGYNDAEPEYWVTNKEDSGKYDTMMYVFDKTTSRYYAMEKSSSYSSDHTWTAYIPNTIKDFSFRRYSIDIDRYWNEWIPSMSSIPTDPKGEYSYVAICGVQSPDNDNWEANIGPCGGYWKNSTGTYRVYFENSAKWGGTITCYAWSGSIAVASTPNYPGKAMTKSHTSDSGNDVYFFDLKETENVTGIQFNIGNDSAKFEVTESKYFFNGMVAWYNGSSNGRYLYTGTNNSLIFS